MRILHVITTINLGGAENHLFQLVSAQRILGHDISVVYLKGDGYWSQEFSKIGVNTYCLNIKNYFLLVLFFRLKNFILSFRPDIIHAHMPPAELVTRLALIFLPEVKFIISKHNAEPFAPYIKNRILANWCMQRASKVICISQAVIDYITPWVLKEISPKLELIYYSVDYEKFSMALPSEESWRNVSQFTVGTVSRLVPQKSLETLLEAFAKLKRIKPDSRLLIAGIGPLEKSLKKASEDLGIDGDVVWIGKRSDIPSIMKAIDIFVLSSIYEGFGLVLLEAMAAGTPVIATNISAIPEVLDYGEAGLLFEAKNSDDLFSKMSLMLDEKCRDKFREKGSVRAKDFFSLKKMIENTMHAYLS